MTPFQLSFKARGKGDRFGTFSYHTSWSLSDSLGKKVLNAQYSFPTFPENYFVCARVDECLTFTVDFDVVSTPANLWDGSFFVWYGGELVEASHDTLFDTRIYQLGDCVAQECPQGTNLFRLELQTEASPFALDGSHDILFWSVLDSSNNVLLQTGFDTSDGNQTFVYGKCFPVDDCYKFIIDGLWNEHNSYEIFWGGESIRARKNGFGSSDLFQFGECSEFECADGFSSIHVTIKTDDYPEETSWAILDSANQPLMQGINYTAGRRHYSHHGICVATSDCLRFSIAHDENESRGWYDTWWYELKGSYSIFVNGELKTAVKGLGGPRQHWVGSCALNPCPEGLSLVQVDLEIGKDPMSVSWMIVDSYQNILLRAGYGAADANQILQYGMCLQKEQCDHFLIEDNAESQQNHGVIRYNVSLGGELI